ncbi:unnamed protein product [Darwinula stevensoni]|uniref:ENTH domain-containing protein n=1 Tax=Darwinula stevensoni TaxID=69355 RepID=A0A7R9AFG8_9CRUS|nr:unnamed protein product [Darwinula stevensoni]CAG0903295.1 unnamed protein product [Darwinula stevensoni]
MTRHSSDLIIGTHEEKGASRFWQLAPKQPIHENQVVAWKFCHVLHKLLRDGHPNVIPQSIRHRAALVELGRTWGEAHGKLVKCYVDFLLAKLKFHENYPGFPGNVQVGEDRLQLLGGDDINYYFQLGAVIFDYLEDILALQSAVFGSLGASQSNSSTRAGHSRLAVLIPCILESSLLFDYTVKIMFKLHADLSRDVLVGHRRRFHKTLPQLRKFYKDAGAIQSLKNLIDIPLLPQDSTESFSFMNHVPSSRTDFTGSA